MAELLALVPCKAFARGKSRLAPALSPGERASLAERFLASTLRRLAELQPAPEIVVLTSDPKATTIARAAGATTVDDQGLDLNPALALAQTTLPAAAKRVLVMPTDLPLADPAAIARFLDSEADVVLAPDRAGSGTNLMALAARAVRDFPFRYGVDSLDLHLAAAAEGGLTAHIVNDPLLALDIDVPEDLELWRGHERSQHDIALQA